MPRPFFRYDRYGIRRTAPNRYNPHYQRLYDADVKITPRLRLLQRKLLSRTKSWWYDEYGWIDRRYYPKRHQKALEELVELGLLERASDGRIRWPTEKGYDAVWFEDLGIPKPDAKTHRRRREKRGRHV